MALAEIVHSFSSAQTSRSTDWKYIADDADDADDVGRDDSAPIWLTIVAIRDRD